MAESRTTAASCQNCGADQEPDIRFCAECGAPTARPEVFLPDSPTEHLTQALETPATEQAGYYCPAPSGSGVVPLEMTSVIPADPVRRPRRRLTLVTSALAAVSVVAAVGVLAVNDRGTHQRLATSQHAYSQSQSRLKGTRTQLATTVSQLTGVQTNLASTQSTLKTTQDSLAAKVQELSGVQNSLTDAKSSLTMQSGQIETLKACLTGVSIAFRDVADGDYSGAVSALQAVKVSCDAAYAML